ncbi:hypothetical protein BQ8794_270070 [Mesorhizobium prunaredense]|uniref:Uncharacterized protein n=1 Tax=Mesorhizobium prunaredense TaxID=1631249 RepID=A0A1R3VAG4_9HYPH|nr:hypothetical protein BQ8794_270070 [Mesorhizobium prunaredense]
MLTATATTAVTNPSGTRLSTTNALRPSLTIHFGRSLKLAVIPLLDDPAKQHWRYRETSSGASTVG